MDSTLTLHALTEVIQICLSDKLKTAFDKNATFTIDIAREVATAMETRCNEYTNLEIVKVMKLLGSGNHDLDSFIDFMHSINDLLSGQDSGDFQVFRELIKDCKRNQTEVNLINLQISEVKHRLNSFSLQLYDHSARIVEIEEHLESQQPTDELKDELVTLVETAFGSACAGVSATIANYRRDSGLAALSNLNSSLTSAQVKLEFDLLPSGSVLFTGKFGSEELTAITVEMPELQLIDNVNYRTDKLIATYLLAEDAETLMGKTFSLELKKSDSSVLGTYKVVLPSVEGYPYRVTVG